MIESNPVEVVVNYLKSDPGLQALVGSRIDTKHHYGDGWERAQASLVVSVSDGIESNYVEEQRLRLELWAYAPTQYEAVQIWRELVDLSRGTSRVTVSTSDGDALLQSFLQASGPSLLFDDDVDMDTCLSFFIAVVGERLV